MRRSVPRQGKNLRWSSLAGDNPPGLALWSLSLVLREIAQESASEAENEQVEQGHENQSGIKTSPPLSNKG
jgi:hypothetical protein